MNFIGNTQNGIIYLEIGDNANYYTYSYTHTLKGLNSNDYNLLDATLELRHRENANNNAFEFD